MVVEKQDFSKGFLQLREPVLHVMVQEALLVSRVAFVVATDVRDAKKILKLKFQQVLKMVREFVSLRKAKLECEVALQVTFMFF